MFTLTNKIKTFSIALIVFGLLGIAYGFYSAPSTIEEAKEIVASSHHDDGHASNHDDHKNDDQLVSSHGLYESELISRGEYDQMRAEEHNSENSEGHEMSHDEHVFHQLANRPWAAVYVAAFFFFMISLGTLAFYAIQRAAQAGWSPLLFRVMEGITGYLLPGGLIVLVILLFSTLHFNHMFIWMDPVVVEHDEIIKNKSGYLNIPFFLARGVFYLAGWSLYRYFSRKFSIAQDKANDNSNHIKNFKISAGFLAFFIVTESMMSWDWIMSIDPHWFSTLFGWYVFASMVVSAITVIALLTIFLKSMGYLEKVNHNHMHDLAKFMFGFSVFWSYLWFSQFMLIWYANIPEEVTYFITRLEDYQLPFLGMLVMNFILPFLILMNSDFKRLNWMIVTAGIIILIGHYMDVFNMIMPSAVGDQWFFGIPELGSVMFFAGLFIYIVFSSLTKAPLEASGDPFNKESEKFVY
jgi:hypothetical protein